MKPDRPKRVSSSDGHARQSSPDRRERESSSDRRERLSSSDRRERRQATAREAKALGHPLRLRILRLCWHQELTNKQLADRLDKDPGTVLYHVRQLTEVGLLEQGPVRAGESGALEKPYRATGKSWWLSGPRPDEEISTAPIEAFQDELREAGPGSVKTFARFALHLSDEDIAELDRRICAVIDEYVATDSEREHLPVHGGIMVIHRLMQ